MIATRLLASAAALVTICGCFPDRALEVRTISLDHLTGPQAAELATPYLSKEGTVFTSKEMLNAITVRDHSRNVERVRDMLSSRDASPTNIALHFQLIRATAGGEVTPGLDRIAEALGELLRFNGYELMSEAVVSASERGIVEQSLGSADGPVQLGARINDVRGYDNNGSAELQVDLRRASGGSLLATNVVVPMGQTVVLGTAYPGSDGSALILTVRAQMGTRELRVSRNRRGRAEAELKEQIDAVEAEAAAEAAAAAAADVHIIVPATPHAGPAHTAPPARAEAKITKHSTTVRISRTPATPAAVTPPPR
jgi:hypothetical protein